MGGHLHRGVELDADGGVSGAVPLELLGVAVDQWYEGLGAGSRQGMELMPWK